MKKKVLSIFLVSVMAVSMLAGCGSDKKETKSADEAAKSAGYAKDAKLKVWGSQEDQDMLQGIIEEFKKENPEAEGWNIETAVVSAADAKNEVLKDPTVAADIFEFASDQIAELQSAGALYRITKNKDEIIANNVENSIDAATVDGEMYGYPNTSNSFFMYYDKSKYTEEEVKSLDTMLAKDLGAGVANFSMDLDNGWYTSSFFFGAGCTLFGEDGTDPKQCDFNNEKGVLVGDYLLDLCTNPKVKNQDDALLLASFKEGKLGASLTGTWNAAALQESLGDNFGVATVPSFTLEDGTIVSPSTIVNFNLYGVNAQTKYPAEAMLLAEYLTNEKSQKTRFEVRNSAPTNKKLAADTELLSTSPAVEVLSKQIETSTVQPSIPQIANFWSPMEAFGQDCIAKAVTKDNMQATMDTMVEGILSKLGD
ncbi:extracellular solute-binding protein [Faecalicatena sp. AGMB00832]|uniref:Extracellular solute-binding protein n=1 Tax=Faecalicatena faecalis TaxID=2726362 RepID=A0ABS6D7W0_9FIRM|nr:MULTISPECIES: extracellular solute-binding protein [Faecalicatena]MBU3877700.1 extracellular solute-binding protein [Faecalicatena faecalis]MCI6466199.1 extracellular solute-binding protein [Faecalicatena sp.]MDY5619365.1 extracellular solute-binding protein [Lachnospiraceae bacterium]